MVAWNVVLLSLTIITTVRGAASATHEVIWERGFNRAAWESNQKCSIGDKLLFSYNPDQNSLMIVSHVDYKSCNPSSPYSTLRTRNSLITIDRKELYFISGVEEECRSGLKLHVHASSSPSPSNGVPSVTVPRPSQGVFSVTTCTLFSSFLCTSVIL